MALLCHNTWDSDGCQLRWFGHRLHFDYLQNLRPANQGGRPAKHWGPGPCPPPDQPPDGSSHRGLCFSFHRKTGFIQEDGVQDGFYVIRTSVGPETLTSEEAVKAYKELSHVETAFRLLKTVDLEIRSVYHVRTVRIRAHAFLCMLAYYLEWHMLRDLAPLLFAEEEPEAQQKTRDTVVSPTRATHVALAKRNKKVTADGFTVQDFRGILKALSNQTQQIVQPAIPKLPTFRRTTPATPYQKRVYDLLQLSTP